MEQIDLWTMSKIYNVICFLQMQKLGIKIEFIPEVLTDNVIYDMCNCKRKLIMAYFRDFVLYLFMCNALYHNFAAYI